jgi:glutathione S-transferase
MIRFALNEARAEYILIEHKFWEHDEKFLRINPMGNVPVLVTNKGVCLNHYSLILEYIFAEYEHHLLPNMNSTLEMKKVCLWFHEKFHNDCGKFFVQEKLVKFMNGGESPNTNILSLARHNFGIHIEYLAYLLAHNTWVCGEKFSIADVTVASHLSILDFFGEISWNKIPEIKDWYCIVKSRPAFRSFLKERISGIVTPSYYSQLDF